MNVGANYEHRFIGFENWHIPGAPFVGGFGGFAHVFVTASFACTSLWTSSSSANLSAQLVGQRVLESLQAKRRIRARTCRGLSSLYFGGAQSFLWRVALRAHALCSILLFYLLSILLIGLNGAH